MTEDVNICAPTVAQPGNACGTDTTAHLFFSGMRGLSGVGGSIADVAITGGDYGIYAVKTGASAPSSSLFSNYPPLRVIKGETLDSPGAQPAPLASKITLKNQRMNAIFYDGRGPLTLVGGIITADRPLTAIRAESALFPFAGLSDGALNIIDTQINFTAGINVGNIPISSLNRSIYLNNVFARNVSKILDITVPPLQNSSRIAEYAVPWDGQQEPVYNNGFRQTGKFPANVVAESAVPTGLHALHSWDRADTATPFFPSFEDANAINALVKRNDGSPCDTLPRAVGDAFERNQQGNTFRDDHPALQGLIDCGNTNSRPLFIPPGFYKISKSLLLRPNSRVIGAGNTYTIISPIFPNTEQCLPTPPTPTCTTQFGSNNPLMETINFAAPDKAPALGFLGLATQISTVSALHWRLGKDSVVRNVNYQRFPWQSGAISASQPNVLISDEGGGRWFNTWHISMSGTASPTFRMLKVDRSALPSLQPPLRFYMLSPTHTLSGINEEQVEFKTARNLDVYTLVGETADQKSCNDTGVTPINTPLLRATDSGNLRIFGQGGIAGFSTPLCPSTSGDEPTSALVHMFNTTPFLFANSGHQNKECVDPPEGLCQWSVVRESPPNGGPIIEAPAKDEWFTLYKRGSPSGPLP